MDELYTINQVAILLKVHPLTVRRYVKEGKLKAVRVGGNVRVALNDVREFMQSFVAHARSPKHSSHPTIEKNFTSDDPLFRLKGRGLSLSS